MPGEHEFQKLEEDVMAATGDEVRGSCIANKEIEVLHYAVRVNGGATFLPWRWNVDALERVWSYGCTLRIGRSYGSFAPSQRSSFAESRATGINISIIVIAVSDAV